MYNNYKSLIAARSSTVVVEVAVNKCTCKSLVMISVNRWMMGCATRKQVLRCLFVDEMNVDLAMFLASRMDMVGYHRGIANIVTIDMVIEAIGTSCS